jgi:hypothetical protein
MNDFDKIFSDVFSERSIEQLKLYLLTEEKGRKVVGSIRSFFEFKKNRRGIPIFSVTTRQNRLPHKFKFKVKERDGTDVLTVSWSFTGIRLETSTLKIHISYNDKITLSERDSKDAPWNETTYTSKGKQTSGQKPELISSDDGDIIVNKILKNVFEETLPNMSLKDKSFVPRFEKAIRSSASKLLTVPKNDVRPVSSQSIGN